MEEAILEYPHLTIRKLDQERKMSLGFMKKSFTHAEVVCKMRDPVARTFSGYGTGQLHSCFFLKMCQEDEENLFGRHITQDEVSDHLYDPETDYSRVEAIVQSRL